MNVIRRHTALIVLLFSAFVFHSVIALIPPLNGDEALFWAWSRNLAAGYYAHPPMTGWLVWLMTSLFGTYKYNVRLSAILLHLGTILLIYHLTWDLLKSKKSALGAALLYAVLPLSLVMGTIMATDSALIFFFTASVYFTKKAVIDGRKRFWYLVGFCAGGMLLSKFLAALFFPGLFLFLVIQKKYRTVFLSKEPYLAAVISAVLFSPFLYWNYTNNWLTFQFNLMARHQDEGYDIVKPFEYIAGQLLIGSPLAFVLMIAALVVFMVRCHGKRPAEFQGAEGDALLLFAYFTAFPLIYFAGTSLGVEVAPHWLAISYSPGVVLLIAWLRGKHRNHQAFPLQSRVFWSSTIIALAITLPLAFIALFPKVMPDKMVYTEEVYGKAPIMSHFFGWKEIGQHIDTIKQEWEHRPEGFFLSAEDYALASMLGFYTPSHPEIFLMNVTKGEVHGKSYLLWEKGKKPIGANTIYIGDLPFVYKSKIPPFFKESRQLEPLVVRDEEGRILRIFYLTLGLHYLGGEKSNISLW